MSEEKFTKGEWKVIDATKINEQSLFVHVECIGIVCRLTKVIDIHIPLSNEDIANAHLIAAAPEMYAMLKDILDNHECSESLDWDIRELLTKARGE